MSRAVYIGGFSGSKKQASMVADALSSYYESDVEPFTFAEAIGASDRIRQATNKVAVVTHSAGMLALKQAGSTPQEIHAFAPPIPFSLRQILGRTIIKTVQMNAGVKSLEDLRCVGTFSAQAMKELVIHPVGNFGNLSHIARFNAVEAACEAQTAGVNVALAYGSLDKYFKLLPEHLDQAKMAGVRVEILEDGVHDDLVLHPGKTLEDYFSQVNE